MDTEQRHEDAPDPDEGVRDRTLLARKWGYLLTNTAFIPMAHNELERRLGEMIDDLCADIVAEPLTTGRSRAVGARLVEMRCVGEGALECILDVLGKGLPALWPTHTERVTRCVGAVAAGFADADRTRLLAQQESMHVSLLSAVREAKWSLRASEARFEEVATASASGIMVTDLDGRFIRVNAALSAILERKAEDLVPLTLFDVVHPDYAGALRDDYAALLAGKTERIKQIQQLMRGDGDYARVTLTASLLPGAGGAPAHFVTVVEDGTELVLLRNELSRQALHDVLTGLPNHHFFSSHLEGVARQAGRHGITLFHIGLDAFFSIAHGCGRRAAEQVLVTVARRLTAAFPGTMVARFDGDEFGIVRKNSAESPTVALTVAEITRVLGEPITMDDTTVAVTASIGVVDRPTSAAQPADLLRAADVALRRAKARGPGQFECYHPEQDAVDRTTHALAASMAHARASGQVAVHDRPIVSLDSGKVVGQEARLKWAHPTRGVLGHRRCVDLAEQTGLILSLGGWLLRTAADRARWQGRRRGSTAALLVSLTPNQTCDDGLVARVAGVLDDTGLDPSLLRLGLPTRVLSAGRGLGNLRELSDLGVEIMADDFDLGGLPLVEDLPITAVRVAAGLACRTRHTALDTALASLPSLVHQAGATVIVDGIRTAADAGWWHEAGADLATGDHFSN
ncbi:EAL domain-containing protein [Actinokineospora sp. 24-640]